MEIPKKVQKLLNKREEYAMALMDVGSRVDDWLEQNGADLGDPDLTDGIISWCMLYAEPGTARMIVEDYIKNKM